MQQATLESDAQATPISEHARFARGVKQLLPEAAYDRHGLAAAFNVHPKTITRWARQGRLKFPRGFAFMGRTHWTGRAIIAWWERQQQEAQS